MHLVYCDESGDDGLQGSSCKLFVLTFLYLHHANWNKLLDSCVSLRRDLRRRYGLKTGDELHTRELLLNKDPYHPYGWDAPTRVKILGEFCRHLAGLDEIRTLTVAIRKDLVRKTDYDVLDTALTYGVQRVHNDLSSGADSRFLIISDEGRVGKMAATTRRMRRFNHVSSHFGGTVARPIVNLIEDPLPKRSTESFFIQYADMIACLMRYRLEHEMLHQAYPKRFAATPEEISACLDILRPRMNLKASPSDRYGAVIYPKS